MADVVNKTTIQYLKSVNTPDYPDKDWWINPVLPACEQKYWKNDKDVLSEMTSGEKAIVDLAEIEAQKVIDAEVIIQDKMREVAIEKGVTDGVLNPDGTLKE